MCKSVYFVQIRSYGHRGLGPGSVTSHWIGFNWNMAHGLWRDSGFAIGLVFTLTPGLFTVTLSNFLLQYLLNSVAKGIFIHILCYSLPYTTESAANVATICR